MSIKFQCSCGRTIKAPFGSSGRQARCPECHTILTIPEEQAGDDYDLAPTAAAPQPTPQPAPPSFSQSFPQARPVAAPERPLATRYSPLNLPAKPTLAPRPPGIRQYFYLFLLLALLPLVFFTFQPHDDVGEKLRSAIEAHPDVSSAEEFFNALPGHRIEGALLPRESKAQWFMALAAAGLFFSFILVAIPRATKYTRGILFAGVFTGTAGIILLLGFQWAAYSLPLVIPRGIVGLIILIVKLIGYSYTLAESDVNFPLSFLGFTCGVGLCEEITKLLPLIFRTRSTIGEEEASWNTLLIWGLASGVGFGIAEGIMYSSRHYNGVQPADIYYVRFLSCVVLHAVWAGSAGIILYKNQGRLAGSDSGWTYCANLVLIALIPMILHGLYDTLLKKGMDVFALIVAVASFALLAYLIESMRRKEPEALLSA